MKRTARRMSATIADIGYLGLLPCLTANTVNPFSVNGGAVGARRTIDVERQRETILVPVYHIGDDRRLARLLGRTLEDSRRCRAPTRDDYRKCDERAQTMARSHARQTIAA